MICLTGNLKTLVILCANLSKIQSGYKFPSLNSPSKFSKRWTSSDGEIKKTCLYNFHLDRQARVETFAGYKMPIVYKNQTIKSEHMQTRESASIFDVSHMMQTVIRGKDRYKFLESLTVADVENLGINKCTLSMITNEFGGIIDDCIIGKRENLIQLVSNAGNAETVWSWLNEKKTSFDVELERLVGKGLIALQGPKSADILQRVVDVKLSEIEFMNTFEVNIKQVGTCQVTRCGYTGEDGFEISVDPENAEKLMVLLCQDAKPAGLGARDTLRLEAGLCLHGHDITTKTTPVEAALSWTIQKRRRAEGEFPGSNIILKQLQQGSKVKRTGLIAAGMGPPAREGSQVKNKDDGSVLGMVTSGTFAPKLGKNIAMAYLPTELSTKYESSVHCDVRGKKYEYKIVKMPFVKSNYYFKQK